jgi:hypothetical protein
MERRALSLHWGGRWRGWPCFAGRRPGQVCACAQANIRLLEFRMTTRGEQVARIHGWGRRRWRWGRKPSEAGSRLAVDCAELRRLDDNEGRDARVHPKAQNRMTPAAAAWRFLCVSTPPAMRRSYPSMTAFPSIRLTMHEWLRRDRMRGQASLDHGAQALLWSKASATQRLTARRSGRPTGRSECGVRPHRAPRRCSMPAGRSVFERGRSSEYRNDAAARVEGGLGQNRRGRSPADNDGAENEAPHRLISVHDLRSWAQDMVARDHRRGAPRTRFPGSLPILASALPCSSPHRKR